MKKRKTHGLVYSTESGRCCPGCGHPSKQCVCSGATSGSLTDGIVRVSRQTKGRKGSGVSLISGLPLPEQDLKKLAKDLKKRCGCGGCVKNGVIEIQGDHRDILMVELQARGFKVKRAGG